MGPRNLFQGNYSFILSILAGRYDNPLPPWFLASIDSSSVSVTSVSLWGLGRNQVGNQAQGCHTCLPVPVFVDLLRRQELIPSLAGRYNPTCYWSFRLHRLIEFISQNRFLGFLNDNKYWLSLCIWLLNSRLCFWNLFFSSQRDLSFRHMLHRLEIDSCAL